MSVVSRLNHQSSLLERLGRKLPRASRFDVAVAFASATGARRLLRLGLPPSTRVVIGLGFAISDPAAIEALSDAGAEVQLVFDRAETFHPKLYLITRPEELVVFSGSGNLTGGGLGTNIEQYEELTFTAAVTRRIQSARFTALWEMGEPFVAS
jgi:HKD family nuclease